MIFEQFFIEIPRKTSEIIYLAIKIYAVLKEESVSCTLYKTNNHIKERLLNDNDKKCLALFLGILKVNSNIKKLLNNSGVNYENILTLFSAYNDIYFNDLNEKEIRQYFDQDFKLLLKKLKRYNTDSLVNKILTPEVLVASLVSKHTCGSSLLDWISREDDWRYILFDSDEYTSARDTKEPPKQELDDTKPITDNSSLFLTQYGNVITEEDYPTNPAIGREQEIREVMLALITEKSVIITGEAGVGKTAVVEGLAHLIKSNQAPPAFANTNIVKINTSTILSGCMYIGMFEERVEGIIKELIDRPDTILFIDEIHTCIGAGAGVKNNMDLADILKPYLDKGQIKIIGTTTNDEYADFIASDEAFKRRFERVNVLEPNLKMTSNILLQSIPQIEAATQVKFTYSDIDRKDIIDLMVEVTKENYRVFDDRLNNPDLALTILKKSFALALIEGNDQVTITNIIDAINTCDRIYESVRKKYENLLLLASDGLINSKTEPKLGKVVQFPLLK